MSKITAIKEQVNDNTRVSVFVDGKFCKGIRKRTFKGMNLKVGDSITCNELTEKEDFYWKQSYAEDAWKKEKVRIDRIKELIESIDSKIKVEIVGFGADSTQIIKEHPEEQGVPDLSVINIEFNDEIMKVEVTGTERLRGTDYWVRPDKIEYSENHPDEVVWTALHYSEPTEKIRFLKHVPGKIYERETKNIRGADEIYCTFDDGDEEVYTPDQFIVEVKKMLR